MGVRVAWPGSVSTLILRDWYARVEGVNSIQLQAYVSSFQGATDTMAGFPALMTMTRYLRNAGRNSREAVCQ